MPSSHVSAAQPGAGRLGKRMPAIGARQRAGPDRPPLLIARLPHHPTQALTLSRSAHLKNATWATKNAAADVLAPARPCLKPSPNPHCPSPPITTPPSASVLPSRCPSDATHPSASEAPQQSPCTAVTLVIEALRQRRRMVGCGLPADAARARGRQRLGCSAVPALRRPPPAVQRCHHRLHTCAC